MRKDRTINNYVSVEINNETRRQIEEEELMAIVKHVLRSEKISRAELSIALVGTQKSRELNKRYRQKDKAANVLSFPIADDVSGVVRGEIILCPAQIQRDAKVHGMIFEETLRWMLIHGILHVAGYDHETETDAEHMEKLEEKYLKSKSFLQ
ncbi:MAG: rRNA maturation RNase YbeY [Candidatus Wildermuthbacteria bacterium RIFCSPHIGHO2_12_FULL_45_9]|uniref:Endoribonuclease YbeY n=1 Tax=Candidatus Wildermuthbacteria bacterium RIFCSPHIGHO2_02_FULL_45_25 TaxID=1802450 RepID=A0A1G2R236_9BACT|nr:MAG: rRNA maturation RNase YbeY [Candidatus Wildermuthbacteria bacterium RIFCSPHIGHO2_01_FULL_45_20]OHA66916.1 MAG: rRNA maturation RNase YbeY [Candidatus Wildermuthbacteria bacterium RIFCSPHIGHO2_02_FULL_45_25]OHA70829.1 MAG: rRNA maturation RNase YbeY [Candidatus Wildermuthbacteria bacterium RIFCSPHIGHO2_12_FULL_45_9]